MQEKESESSFCESMLVLHVDFVSRRW